MKQKKKNFGSWVGHYRCHAPWMKMLLLLVLSLHFFAASAQLGSNVATPKGMSNDYSDLKKSTTELLDKLKSTNYGSDFDGLRGSLTGLSAVLDNTEPSDLSVQQLTESAKSEFEKLKNNPNLSSEVSGLKSSFEDFSKKGTTAIERAKSLIDNGVAVSMPVTVPYLDNGPFSIRISFDSLRFVQGDDAHSVEDDNTLVDVDATFNFPFATSSDGSHVVRFHGDGIRLEGGNKASRIYLESDHRIDLMKNKVAVEILSKFPEGGKSLGGCSTGDRTWLDFDCNGVQDMCLCGRFLFSKSFITAASKGRENDTVMAYFSFMYSSGMIAKICFSDSFRVKGCGDFVFKVEDAIVDLSDDRNANGFSFPPNYWDESGLPEEAWSGFFLSKLAVRFPDNLDFNKKKDKQATLEVKNVLIDDYGFTGNFLLRDFVDTQSDDNNNSGLALAVDTISVSIWQGDFSDGLILGRANVPFLQEEQAKPTPGKDDGSDDGDTNGQEMNGYNLGFRGHIGYNAAQDKYLFSINASLKADQHFKVPFTNKASIDITKDSYIEVGNDNSDEKFGASLCLNGALNIESSLKLKGVRFEGLKFSSLKPHVSVKAFSLIGTAGFSVGGFSIELKKIGLKTPHLTVANGVGSSDTNEKDKADLNLEVQISLMAGEGGIGAGVGMDVHAEHEKRWKVKGLTINKIMLDLDFSAFHLKGEIERFKNDTKYGDGFRGGMMLTLKEFGFGVQGEGVFGKVTNENGTTKYWFTKATADLSGAKILLFPPGVFLKSFSGGAYHHMSCKSYAEKGAKKVTLSKGEDYTPDNGIQFGFMAGIGVYFMDDKLCSANVEFEMNFNSNWGVNYVKLAGIASILAPLKFTDTKADGMIAGWLIAEYDRPNKTFHSEIGATIDAFDGLLKGGAQIVIHSDPKEWYFWMGTRSNPNYLQFAGLVKAESYFMLGVIETPMPPMREKLAAKLNLPGSSNAVGKETEIQKGKGFAFGISLEAGGQLSLPLNILYAHFYFLAGTDILVTSSQCGKLSWRASGQAYVCADGGVGATLYYPWWCKWHPCIKNKEFNILSGSVMTVLSGEIPSPIRVSGDLYVKCKLFFIPMPKINIHATIGKGC